MAEKTRKISEYEFDANLMIIGDVNQDKKVTADEFAELSTLDKVIGVNHEDRTEWLERNGYEVTRANMMDGNLESNLEAQVAYDKAQKSKK